MAQVDKIRHAASDIELIDEPIQLFKPYHGEEEIEAVSEVLRSGWWGQGPKTVELEQKFAAFVESPIAVSFNSATADLHLAMTVAEIEGYEVITTPRTFVSSNHAILYNRGIPVFADVERDTLNIDADDIERKVTNKTNAIVAV